jgi:hypothetical protein
MKPVPKRTLHSVLIKKQVLNMLIQRSVLVVANVLRPAHRRHRVLNWPREMSLLLNVTSAGEGIMALSAWNIVVKRPFPLSEIIGRNRDDK